MHLEAAIERVWRYALGGHVSVTLEAVVEPDSRSMWRP